MENRGDWHISQGALRGGDRAAVEGMWVRRQRSKLHEKGAEMIPSCKIFRGGEAAPSQRVRRDQSGLGRGPLL